MKIQTKLINHISLNGKKETGEKNLRKSFKRLQKTLKKNSQEIFQLALIYTTPIFKLHKIKNKKVKKGKKNKFREIPGFIKNQKARTSRAIKFILSNTKGKGKTFYEKLNREILTSAKNEGASIETKNQLQKIVLTKKHFFRYYKWN